MNSNLKAKPKFSPVLHNVPFSTGNKLLQGGLLLLLLHRLTASFPEQPR